MAFAHVFPKRGPYQTPPIAKLATTLAPMASQLSVICGCMQVLSPLQRVHLPFRIGSPCGDGSPGPVSPRPVSAHERRKCYGARRGSAPRGVEEAVLRKRLVDLGLASAERLNELLATRAPGDARPLALL